MKILILLISFFFLSNTLFAQDQELETEIIDHSNIEPLILGHKKVVKKSPFSDGYRIQIYNGNEKEEAMKIKTQFYSKFPNIRCYTLYQQPYYKVRVGDYPNPEAAKNDLKMLSYHYPSSFLVPEKIRRSGKEEEEEKNTKGVNK
jgi:hypothetical protein